MLNMIGKGILGLIVVAVLAYILGVRIHPEALGSAAPAVSGLEKIQLTNGKVLVGRLVSESPAGLLIDISGVQMTLTSGEIAGRSPLTDTDIASGNYSEWLAGSSSSSKQFITYSESDNLILQRMGSKKKKSVIPAGTSAWGARTKDYKLPSEQAKQAPKGSMMDIYQKSMSKESLDAWKNEATARMNEGRNPFVEAFKKKDESAT